MDKEKPDATLWADNGGEFSSIIHLITEDNPIEKLNSLKMDNDFLILDTPPNSGTASLKAVMLSDIAIIPCAQSSLDKNALTQSITAAQIANKPYYMFASNVKKNTKLFQRLQKEIRETQKDLKTYISHSVVAMECQESGQWVGSYRPNCTLHLQFKHLSSEIISLIEALQQPSQQSVVGESI